MFSGPSLGAQNQMSLMMTRLVPVTDVWEEWLISQPRSNSFSLKTDPTNCYRLQESWNELSPPTGLPPVAQSAHERKGPMALSKSKKLKSNPCRWWPESQAGAAGTAPLEALTVCFASAIVSILSLTAIKLERSKYCLKRKAKYLSMCLQVLSVCWAS